VRAGQTHPHRPRLVVSHSTCPPLSSSPHAHSFVIGPAVIKHTQAKRSNDFWEDAVAWEAQRVEALKERKLRTQTAKRWAFAAEQEEEQQAIAEEAERRAAIHENATKAAKCLIDGFVWAREAQEEAADRAREKDKHWAWWLEEILKAGFDVYDFCDASFAPLDDETMELKFSSKEDGPRQRSHSPIVISSDDEADDKDMPQDQEPEDTTTQECHRIKSLKTRQPWTCQRVARKKTRQREWTCVRLQKTRQLEWTCVILMRRVLTESRVLTGAGNAREQTSTNHRESGGHAIAYWICFPRQ
jgi:hypothetical protein